MTVLVDLDGRVVMRIVYAVLSLIEDQTWLLEHSCVVVIATDHTLEITLAILWGSAINEESLVDFLSVCRHRNVLHCVGSKSS